MIVVYLSSAMSAPTVAQFRKNCRRAARVAHTIRHAGFAVHCPGENGLVEPEKEMSWKRWMAHDYAILNRTDVCFRLLPDPAGRVSKGAEAEVRFCADHAIPVVYSLPELKAFRKAHEAHGSAAAYVASREWVA